MGPQRHFRAREAVSHFPSPYEATGGTLSRAPGSLPVWRSSVRGPICAFAREALSSCEPPRSGAPPRGAKRRLRCLELITARPNMLNALRCLGESGPRDTERRRSRKDRERAEHSGLEWSLAACLVEARLQPDGDVWTMGGPAQRVDDREVPRGGSLKDRRRDGVNSPSQWGKPDP